MTATVPATGHHRATAQAERIARLFAEGHDLTTVAQQGAVNGWTRGRALEVVSQRGWTLDSSGRVPRHQRPAVTPGKPLPSVPAGMPGVGTIGGQRPVVAEPKPSPGRAQVDTMLGAVPNALPPSAATVVLDPEPASSAPEPNLTELAQQARAAQQREADAVLARVTQGAVTQQEAREALGVPGADALLARADRSGTAKVASAARAARACLAELATLLAVDEEAARLRARLAEIDAERREALHRLAELGALDLEPDSGRQVKVATPAPAGPKTRPTVRRPIAHGTWGGRVAHQRRGEPTCDACLATSPGKRKATP